jgi:HCNGP-like protein
MTGETMGRRESLAVVRAIEGGEQVTPARTNQSHRTRRDQNPRNPGISHGSGKKKESSANEDGVGLGNIQEGGKMNGDVSKRISRNVTVEDDPEPGDPPPKTPSPSPQQSPSPNRVSPRPSSPQIIPLDSPASEEPEYMTPLAYTNSLIRQATMPVLPPDLDDFGIPPSPPGSPDPTLSRKLDNFRQLRERGVYFNDRLGGNKGFRNPRLLERLRGYVGVEDEYGSQLPATVWNPHGFKEDQYFDKLGITI